MQPHGAKLSQRVFHGTGTAPEHVCESLLRCYEYMLQQNVMRDDCWYCWYVVALRARVDVLRVKYTVCELCRHFPIPLRGCYSSSHFAQFGLKYRKIGAHRHGRRQAQVKLFS